MPSLQEPTQKQPQKQTKFIHLFSPACHGLHELILKSGSNDKREGARRNMKICIKISFTPQAFQILSRSLTFNAHMKKRASVHHLSSPFAFQENGTRHRCPLFKDFENECHRGSRDHAFPLARRRISTLFSLNMSNNKTCEYLDPG